MGRPIQKPGKTGIVKLYISRQQAMKKLQLSLHDFRRLCILKGVYPREPKQKKKLNKGNSTLRTYYYTKDILYLAHEPIIQKFREFKVFTRRLKKALGRKESSDAQFIKDNQPIIRLDHIVKERYPTFVDAVRDLDDCLCLVFLFGILPVSGRVQGDIVKTCRRLSVEFMNYVIASKSLRKMFVSIKGIYYQADIQGQTVTWIVPHNFRPEVSKDVDFRIMLMFLEFYTTMLKFVNFKLYHSLNLIYPPQPASVRQRRRADLKLHMDSEADLERLASLVEDLKQHERLATDEPVLDEFPEEVKATDGYEEAKKAEEALNKLKVLFEGLKFYVNREVPREPLVFVIRSFGGKVSWESSHVSSARYSECEPSITHHVVDRPQLQTQHLNRYYVQPQWVFDCVNAGRLLPVDSYVPGATLPPHLSPFAYEGPGSYIPPERQSLLEEEAIKKADGKPEVPLEESKGGAEEERLAAMMMPKKKRRIYDSMMKSKKKAASKVRHLSEKRKRIDETRQLAKKVKTADN